MKGLRSDLPFFCGLGLLTVLYVGFVLILVLANFSVVTWGGIIRMLSDPYVLGSVRLTLLTCTISAILAVLFAVPIGYVLARYRFRGRGIVDAVLDIPIVLPPLVVGLSLLLLFNRVPVFGTGSLEEWVAGRGGRVTFGVAAIVLAQWTVATAFAVRLVQTTFEQMDRRYEQVALTLGCHQSGAFWRVALPQAGRGIVAAGVMAWARALGEFGPILVFAGATRGRTEVLATSVFLELNIGNLSGAAAVALLMILIALLVIAVVRVATRRSV